MSKAIKMAIPVCVGIVVYLIGIVAIDFAPTLIGPPKEEGGAATTLTALTQPAWLFLSIFVAVIVGLILEPVPPALVGIIGVAVAVYFRVGAAGSGEPTITSSDSVSITWGLSGMANTTVWLIFSAFAIGLGFQKSGLGRRIAMLLMSKLGKSTLGLGYAIALTDGVLSPFIPSNTARSGGVVYPIISSIPPMFESYPDKNPRKIGSYVMWVALASTCVTSSMFLTALAPNAAAITQVTSATKAMGIEAVSWLGWMLAFLPAGIILFILTPWLTYKLYPPEVKGSPEVAAWAKDEASQLGKMTSKEISMIGIAGFALVFWILSSFDFIKKIWPLMLNGTTTALIVLAAMLLFKVITWDDFLGNKPAWNVLIWFGTLVALADGLKNVGFLGWLGKSLEGPLKNLGEIPAVILLLAAFWLLHYFFASTTAHVTALMALFATITMAIFPSDPSKVYLVCLLLMLELGVMGIITPYGTGPSPVYFGSGYVPSGDFWRLGTIFGFTYLIIFLVIEIPWVLYLVPGLVS
jgi:citrate:succinate antiporter/L-tartrate/succinate antiporter